jgi:Rad3-related DNA helicase
VIIPKPSQLDVPHNEWRPHQYESIKWVDDLADSGESVALLQAKTGSGKTGVGKGIRGPVTALMSTKPLLDQYTNGYGFEKLFGMASYPCALAIQNLNVMADACIFTHSMTSCPAAHECQYLIQRELLKASPYQALTYAYFLLNTSGGGWLTKAERRVAYLDEGHNTINLLMSFDELKITIDKLNWAGLDKWNPVKFNTGLAKNVSGVKRRFAMEWMEEAIGSLAQSVAYFNGMATEHNQGPAKRARSLMAVQEKIANVLSKLESHPDIYFIDVNDEEFIVSPLTAKLSFLPRFVDGFNHTAVLTSATFGNPKQFLGFIGMPSSTPFRDVPSNFTAEQQPVFVDKEAPRMNYRSKDSDKQKWAERVTHYINMLPDTKSGIVHTASKYQAYELSKLLAKLGMEDRVWVPPESMTTDQRATALEREVSTRKEYGSKGVVAISWNFFEGIDAGFCDFSIIAKTPFATLDKLGKARFEFDRRRYLWEAAISIEQAAGRVRRGREEDYEYPNKPLNKVVAIVDGNYTKVKKQFSDHFKSLLVEQ